MSLNYLKNYLSAISPDFLFLTGDESKFINNPNHGGMYFWFLPLFFLGLAKIILEKEKTQYQFLFGWFLASPLMSAIAGPPNFIRSNMVFIPVAVICALGVFYLMAMLNRFKVRRIYLGKIFMGLVIIISFLSTIVMFTDYFFVYTKKAMAWDEYYPQIFSFLKKVDNDYQVIYLHNFNTNSYIYLLFYEAIDPKFFLREVKRDNDKITSVGKYQLVDIDFSGAFCRWQSSNKPKTLVVTDDSDLWVKSIARESLLTVKSYNSVHTLAFIFDIGKTVDYLISQKVSLPGCDKEPK